jgi:glycosyltransferase involved in cell wall biosynthesis
MTTLSVIIPARNEMFLRQTVENVLANSGDTTEVIAVCDGNWPTPPLQDHPRLTVLHYTVPIGQRGATNAGARVSRADFIMKLDAHCAVAPGFDGSLMADCHPDWTMVPAQHKLHAFDWQCGGCGCRTYQGSKPTACVQCGSTVHHMVVVWAPKAGGPSMSWRFDNTMHFQYWRKHVKRRECQGDFIETLSCIGACFFMRRDRFLALGGMDEGHGSWGQFGTEIACKSWLSGGALVTTRRTWYAHLFRTGNFSRNGESAFPYPLSGEQQEAARVYSRNLWLHDRWPLATRKLSWLVEKFKPVPGWHDADPDVRDVSLVGPGVHHPDVGGATPGSDEAGVVPEA